MKLLMLCGYFSKTNEEEVMRHAKAPVEFSANLFQKKLISGFRQLDIEMDVLSAPFIGSYPNASDIMIFRGFEKEQDECRYVPFVNVWGIRNYSRSHSLKTAINDFIGLEDNDKCIIIYCPHTPFLEAAVYAKTKDPNIRICLYVPDLPQYMNLSANRSKLYDIAKSYDIAIMNKLMKQVDAFVLLTAPMADLLPIDNKPYIVVEGIVESLDCPDHAEEESNRPEKYIVYTGKLDERFGVKSLIDAFSLVDEPTIRLVLCGRGDCDSYAHAASMNDSRILVMGQVSPIEAHAWQNQADILVNPRPGNEEYTLYSFPSKNIEYLLTGKRVVAYLLPGMPECYKDFIFQINSDLPHEVAIAQAINNALFSKRDGNHSFREYAEKKLLAKNIAASILNMCHT